MTAEMIRRNSGPGDPASVVAALSDPASGIDGAWAPVVSALIRAIFSEQEIRLEAIIAEILDRNRPFLEVYSQVLMPVCVCVRGRWSREEASFVEITLASGRIALAFNSISQAYVERHLMREESDALHPGDAEARLLLARMPGDNHALGLQIVETVFRQSGWRVQRGGDGGHLDSCFQELKRDHFDVFGLSVGITSIVGDVAIAIDRARAASLNSALHVCIGGAGVLAAPEAFTGIGADFFATDALEGVALANRAVGFNVLSG
ncbi:cobalamin B12-binding domain-containing protein [Stappia stellulata]|uniref:cobalamin B12-binding domain-containing protein n=1 Tax=Stappia stellulata TaxID=71235 RepID=UPI00146D26C8|nr:cobalamin-dependent protein [Stappia stellulata]